MRIIKILVPIILLFVGAYFLSMYYLVDESKNFKVEKQIDYSLEEVYPQFNNLQKFTRWNNFFSSSKNMHIDYYTPYEGQGSSLSYLDKKTNDNGELIIHYENPLKTLNYNLFENEKENASQIQVKFSPISPTKTKIVWEVHSPKLPVFKRVKNFWTEDVFTENIDKSMVNLKNVLGNIVGKDEQIAGIKYDTLMVEKAEGQLLFGINVSTANKKDAMYKNVAMNYNKVYNFVTADLGKTDDEFGYSVLVIDPDNYKDKEVSYFLGIPLSKRISVADNNFSFKTIPETETYVMYYKGSFEGRIRVIQQLLQKAKKEEMRVGDLRMTFIEAPYEGQDVSLKLSLQVYK